MARSCSAPRAALRVTALSTAWALRIVCLVLLLAPIVLVIYLSFGADSYTVIPPSAYSLRWYRNIAGQDAIVSGFLTSVEVAAIATPASVLIGAAAAYGVWRSPSRHARRWIPLFMAPVMLPLVVTGLALLSFYARIHFYGGFVNIVIAHVLITFPYSLRAVLAALDRYDRRLDEAAASVGVGEWSTVLHVTLPSIHAGVFAAALFTFVMSFDDFAATIFLITPDTTTLPIAIYQYMQFNLDPTVSAVSAVQIAVILIAVLIADRFIGLEKVVGLEV
ncbi:ABC transporter permease [Paraburkholderia sp. J41]|uniref:ABC transporter permease n=1 Tax=Paraburkholderia sp. J41 TaxID=2805433 RepID=UPI002AC3592A|nr:ABC transporter permease [Paraburkholderia sp. J41]